MKSLQCAFQEIKTHPYTHTLIYKYYTHLFVKEVLYSFCFPHKKKNCKKLQKTKTEKKQKRNFICGFALYAYCWHLSLSLCLFLFLALCLSQSLRLPMCLSVCLYGVPSASCAQSLSLRTTSVCHSPHVDVDFAKCPATIAHLPSPFWPSTCPYPLPTLYANVQPKKKEKMLLVAYFCVEFQTFLMLLHSFFFQCFVGFGWFFFLWLFLLFLEASKNKNIFGMCGKYVKR